MFNFSQLCASGRIMSIAALAGSAIAPSAAEADIKLRVGHVWPANHYIQRELIDVFTAKVTERSGGTMTFETYPAAQLGKDVPATLQSGLLDIGLIATGSHPDLFPLSSVGELPQAAATACEGTARSAALAKPGGPLDQAEWQPQGFRVLTASMLAPYGLFARNFPINSPNDISGRKIWASGPAAETVIKALDGVPIRIPSTELYDSASRGTVDAAIFPYSGIIQYELAPILNSTADGVSFGSGVFFMVMNESFWDGLDPSQQTVLSETAQEAELAFCRYIDTIDQEQRDKLHATTGFVASELGGEGLEQFKERLLGVGALWAETFDKAGLPGTSILEAYRAVKLD